MYRVCVHKLHRPALGLQLSLRPHLIERLNAGTYGDTLVSAPAGYGKSTSQVAA